MKRALALILTVAMTVTMLFACTSVDSAPTATQTQSPPDGVINLWSFTDEIPEMVNRYKELNPEFNYEIKATIIATTDGAYQPALDRALSTGGEDAPDIYAAEAAFVLKYTQGDSANYAASYADLGIDVPGKLQEAAIAQYAADIGTRGDGALVGLPYQATGGAYIYRRSIAKDVWGTDDPSVIKNKIGPGWDKFIQAAAELSAKGYAIVSGDGDIWHPLENNSEKGWIVDGKLYIDPGREQFIDLAKQLKDNNYMNTTRDWEDSWYADMKDLGPKKVFGFFGPAWLINYIMADNSGGTKPGEGTYGDWAICEPTNDFSWGGTWVLANKDTPKKDAVRKLIEWITLDTSEGGLQYMWANGTLNGPGGTKDTVASGTVMAKSDGTLDFLGGQDMFDVFVPAGANATGTNKTQYDESINLIWRNQVRYYVAGEKSRDQAIADFKKDVVDSLGIPAE